MAKRSMEMNEARLARLRGLESGAFLLALVVAILFTPPALAQTAFVLGASQADDARAIALDDAGNVFVTGQFRLTVDFDPGPGVANLTAVGSTNYLASYDEDGTLRFAHTLGAASLQIPERGLGVDDAGNVYVSGWFSGLTDFDPGPGTQTLNPADGNLFVASYDGTGAFRFAFNLGGDDPSFGEAGNAIAVDAAGNSYLTGEFSGETDFDPTGPGELLVQANGIGDAFLASYTSSGSVRFAIGLGGAERDRGLGIEIDDAGNSYVTGSFRGTVDFDPDVTVLNLVSNGNREYFLASYTDGGALRYAVSAGGGFDDAGEGVGVDAAGNAFVTGWFQDSADFDPGPGVLTLTAAGNGDIFLASYTPTGALRFAYGFGASNNEQGKEAEVDDAGNVHLTGFVTNAVDFDPGPGTAIIDPIGTDAFVVSYTNAGGFRSAYNFRSNPTAASLGYDLALDASARAHVIGSLSGSNVDTDPGTGTALLSSSGSTDGFFSSYGLPNPVPALAPTGGIALLGALGLLGWRRLRAAPSRAEGTRAPR